jgi:hypothetical protein
MKSLARCAYAPYLLLVACLLLDRPAAAQPALRRFVLTVAENDGGSERIPLKYAPADAALVRSTLVQLGGVAAADAQQLVGPRGAQLAQAFARVAQQVQAARSASMRTELVFYYSGHSDETGILLGAMRLPYPQLRALLDTVPADVHIAILDSCASAAFTRAKGGTPRPAFLFDASTQIKGYAFLASAAADEAAQESDRIGGSFFTHYLVSGLRGAADSNTDGKVTLTEAYRFAFDETLARTGLSRFGAQHPAYDIRLAGTGDLVMTDLRVTAARLELAPDVEGRVFVRDAGESLLVELRKPGNRRVILALPTGDFSALLEWRGERYLASGRAEAGALARLTRADFHEVWPEPTAARGGFRERDTTWFGAALAPPYSTNPRVRAKAIVNHADFALLYDDPDAVEGLQLSLGVASAAQFVDGVQVAPVFSYARALRGVQLSALVNRIGDAGAGAQLALLGNDGGRSLEGVQLGVLNVADFVRGAQLAFGLNVASSRAQGLSAGAVNYARDMDGVQLGAVNTAGVVRGVQLGAVNVASERAAVQLGVFNYARDADVALGLISFTERGGAHVQVTTSDVALVSLAVRLDANYNYSFVAFGFHPVGGDGSQAYMFGAAWGLKLPLYTALVWFDIDLGYYLVEPLGHFQSGLPNSLGQLRLMPRLEIDKHLSVFAGLSMNVLVQLDPDRRFSPGYHLRSYRLTHAGAEQRVTLWPGFVVGVRF